MNSKLDINILNNLNFKKVDKLRFPLVKVLDKLNNKSSLFETVLVAANDELVNMYLKGKIRFTDIHKNLFKFLNRKEFMKFNKIQPKKIDEIIELSYYVRSKINSLSV